MATIINDRDITLQATTPRLQEIGSNKILLLPSATNFVKTAGGIQPSTITIKPVLTGILNNLSNLTWSASPAITYSVADDKVITINSSDITLGTPVTFTATLVFLGITYTTSIVINSLQETIVSTLSKSSVSIATASDGSGGDYTAATSTMTILVGNTDDSSNWTYSWSVPASVTATGAATRTITVSAISVNTPITLTCTATKTGYTTQTKDFVVAKSLAGSTGSPGNPGNDGLAGIVQRIAYQLVDQAAATPTYTASTSGGTSLPGASWQATVPTATVGNIVWYIYGQYNPNGVTYQGISANTTSWSAPIAASVFQDIRSDNYNGPNPATSADYGTAGYYIKRSTGELFASNAYLRGSLITGSTNAQRVEVNLSSSNRVKVFNSSNVELASFGGTGDQSDYVLKLSPQWYNNIYAAGTKIDIPTYSTASSPRNTWGLTVSDNGASGDIIYANLGFWQYASALNINRKVAVEGRNGGYYGYLGYYNAYSETGGAPAGHTAAGYFWNGTAGPGTTALSVALVNNQGYAIQIFSGTFRYNNVTIDTPPNTTTTYLRGDGTWQSLLGSIAANYVKNGSVATNAIELRWDGTTSKAKLYIDNTYVSNGFEAAASGGGTTTNALTIGTGLSGTSFNGSSAVTIAIDNTVATLTGTQTLTNKTLNSPVIGSAGITFNGSSSGTSVLTAPAVAGTATAIILPSSAGTLIGSGDTSTVTNTMLAGSIANAKLANSSITVNGSAISLGGSATVTANTTNNLTFNNTGSGVASGSTFNGGSAVTVSYNTIGAAASSHTHTAADITSGTLSTARLGSGTASSSTWLRGDSTWQ